jgi:hypothetical protein
MRKDISLWKQKLLDNLKLFARYNISEGASLFFVLVACCYDLSRQLLIRMELLVHLLDGRCELLLCI